MGRPCLRKHLGKPGLPPHCTRETMMLRTPTLLLVSALGTVVAAQESPQLNFPPTAAPVGQVLSQLSSQAGVTLQASPALRNDVLMLRLKEADLNETMKRIATVLRGQWERTSQGYVLNRTPNMAAADERAENEARATALRAAINRLAERLRKEGAFGASQAEALRRQNEQRMAQIENGAGGRPVRFGEDAVLNPSSRAIVGLLAAMGDSRLRDLAVQKRVVLSMRPTPMQQPLPSDAMRIATQFVQEQTVLTPPQPPQEFERRVIVSGMTEGSLGSGDPSRGVGFVMMVVRPGLTANSLTITLTVADPNGGTLATGSMPLNLTPTTETPPTANNAKKIELSAQSKLLNAMLAGTTVGGAPGARINVMMVNGATMTTMGPSGGPAGPANPEHRSLALDLGKVDPLSLTAKETFRAAIEAEDKNLVAHLPDTIVMPLATRFVGSGLAASEVFSYAENSLSLRVVRDGGWIHVEPREPHQARARSVDRAGLARFLRLLNDKGAPRLDDFADYAFAQAKAPAPGEWDTAYVRAVSPQTANGPLLRVALNGWPTLRLFGSLNTAQRQALRRGQPISVASLTGVQREILAEDVFQSMDGPLVLENNQPQQMPPRPVFFGSSLAVRTERTNVLPSGLPANAVLRASVSNQTVLQSETALATLDDMAMTRMMQSQPELAARFGQGVETTNPKYRVGATAMITLTAQLAPGVTLSRMFEDPVIDMAQTPVPYDSLPADLKAEIERRASEIARRFSGGPGGGIRVFPSGRPNPAP